MQSAKIKTANGWWWPILSLIQLQICIQSERRDAEFSWLNEWNCKKWPANAAEAERRLECRDRVTAPFLLLAILQPSWKQEESHQQNQQANHLISVICAGRSHVSITAQIIATNSREPFLNRTSHAGKKRPQNWPVPSSARNTEAN
jgi:hypothetical protein